MQPKSYNKINFHKHTFCVFKEVADTSIENLKVDFKSKSGSKYYFTPEGVYRESNHWGRAANCKWRLAGKNVNSNSRNKIGFALWTDFQNDNNTEKIYYIEVDYKEKTAAYSHKNFGILPENAILRTASETAKTIKQIRNLFENDSWKKHFDTNDVEELRRKIIERLLTSNLSILQIKSEIRATL